MALRHEMLSKRIVRRELGRGLLLNRRWDQSRWRWRRWLDGDDALLVARRVWPLPFLAKAFARDLHLARLLR